MKLKKFLALLLALTVVFPLAACGGGSMGNDAEGTEDEVTEKNFAKALSVYKEFRKGCGRYLTQFLSLGTSGS